MSLLRKLSRARTPRKSASGRSTRVGRCKLRIDLPEVIRPVLHAELSFRLKSTAAKKTTRKSLKLRNANRLADILAAMGHPVRLHALGLLLGGSASYDELVMATGVRSGPLYFHLQQLRSAGLIGPRRRNEYTLTYRGRVMAMVTFTIGQLRY